MKRVLDSYALLAFFEKEPGFEKVESFLVEANEKHEYLLMSVVNYGEVYYIVLREYGKKKADEIESLILTLPIEMLDVNKAIVKEAAGFKAFKKISYADCFAAALAKMHQAELITGDKEFKEVEDEITVLWI
jgi:predicted nucleic acid-binding protein